MFRWMSPHRSAWFSEARKMAWIWRIVAAPPPLPEAKGVCDLWVVNLSAATSVLPMDLPMNAPRTG
jgi:hypothetical protein